MEIAFGSSSWLTRTPSPFQVLEQIEHDEFASYFVDGVAPKLLITTTKQASKELYEFCKEFCDIFPTGQFVKRGAQYNVKHLVDIAKKREFTDLVIVGEHRKVPSEFYL